MDTQRRPSASYQAPALRYEFAIAPKGVGYRALKRALDVVAALAGLLVALPVMVVVALAVRMTGSPVLFRQVRLGRAGRPFTLVKFRTLAATADPYAPKPAETASSVTRIGRILRATGLDELPQLVNVLRGQMTLVGPRPEMPFVVEGYDEIHRLRMNARPGITGLWQISPVRKRPIHHHIEYDLFYLAHRSLLLDLWIILRTPLVLLFGRHISLDRRVIKQWGRGIRTVPEEGRRVVLDLTDPDETVVDLVTADV